MPREIKPRAYWTHFSVELSGNADLRREGKPVEEHGLGFGSRVEFVWSDGTWMTDEQIDIMAAQNAKHMAQYMKDMRDREMRRAKAAAEPFWMKWLGA